MEPYDPRQWSSRGLRSGAPRAVQHRAGSRPMSMIIMSGNEVSLPEPPPPYGQDTLDLSAVPNRPGPSWEGAPGSSSPSLANISARAAPTNAMSAAFPPPPAHPSGPRERLSSGLANHLLHFRSKQPPTDFAQSDAPFVTQSTDGRPPAARRALSADPVQNSSSPARAAGRTLDPQSPEAGWQTGMPLPGPPPGPPPPSGPRSQSLNRIPSYSSQERLDVERPADQIHQRRVASSSVLGPVPPTPAHWIDSDHPPPQTQYEPEILPSPDPTVAYHPLRIDTGTGIDHSGHKRHIKRDSSIHERRSRSRAAREGATDGSSSSSDAAKIKSPIGNTAEGAISHRREARRPKSFYPEPTAFVEQSASSTGARSSSQPAKRSEHTLASPPLTSDEVIDDSLRRRSAVRRPFSTMLSSRGYDESTPASSDSPGRQVFPAAGSPWSTTNLNAFLLKASERHRIFIEKEASAATDEERLELFANFLVHESRLRRDHYSAAYTAMASNILDLTRDMWRPYANQSKRSVTPSTSASSLEPSIPAWASDGQTTSAHGNIPSSASSFGDFTPGTEAGSINESPENVGRSVSRQWADEFKPSLSPITASETTTTTRGRQSSRWFESNSQSSSNSIGKPGRIEKSLRETKYMGVSAADLQLTASSPELSSDVNSHNPVPGTSHGGFLYLPDEYPPEKVGLHDSADMDTPLPTPAYMRVRRASPPGFEPLDVSRLVTLPPPYPRHHPAISNSHPSLTDLRTEQRNLADPTEIRRIKDAFIDEDFAVQDEQRSKAKERRQQLRLDVQERISSNSMSFAEAAQAEAEFDREEAQREKSDVRSNFDLFEAKVAHPLNSLLTQRLEKADACISRLRTELAAPNASADPNQIQEEGDEQPERLEQLTLLKWLFDTREQLHKEMLDLHADRSAKYSEVVLTPFRLAKLQGKIDNATAFFERDASERQGRFVAESAARFDELRAVVEDSVSRGVEAQLSAFWDIAPSLLEVIQHVPAVDGEHEAGGLGSLEILIPPHEYEENPAYAQHPMQYFYSLLAHAEKSTFQFIESQTNLLCLLHEVRTAAIKATLRLREVERATALKVTVRPGQGAADEEALHEETRRAIHEREQALTADLQDKVGEIERQWREALGDAMEECKGQVKGLLEDTGGWEDGLE